VLHPIAAMHVWRDKLKGGVSLEGDCFLIGRAGFIIQDLEINGEPTVRQTSHDSVVGYNAVAVALGLESLLEDEVAVGVEDHVDGMQPPAVGIKVGHDLKGHDLGVESLGILQVVVPNLVSKVVEEFGNATFGCFVAGVVVEVGFVGGLGANTDNSRGIIGNVPVVEREAGRQDKLGAAMVRSILGSLREDGCEGMGS
jgi:hypothetical protein